MSTLTRYLSFRLLLSAAGVTVLLSAITEIIDLFDTTDDILQTRTGFGGFVYYIVMRLPSIVPQVLPLGVLIAALIMLALLARNGEIVAMRNAGLSTARIVAALMPAAIVAILVHYAIAESLTGPAEEHLAAWWAAGLSDPGGRANRPVWLKVDGSVVSIERVGADGRQLGDLTIYKRDPAGVVTGRIKAETAAYHAGSWTLAGAVTTRWPPGQVAVDRPDDGPWKSDLQPESVMAALTPDGHISARAADAVLSGRRIATTGRPVYRTALQRAFAAPVASLVMLLLAAPMAFADPRRAGSGRHLLIGLGAGLVFMLVDGLAATLGDAGIVDPVAASWLPLAFFCLFALFRLKRLENIRSQA